jgi:hypothetical protein
MCVSEEGSPAFMVSAVGQKATGRVFCSREPVPSEASKGVAPRLQSGRRLVVYGDVFSKNHVVGEFNRGGRSTGSPPLKSGERPGVGAG